MGKMEGRNKRRFLATFPQLSSEELKRLTAKPSDALLRRYDMDLRDAIRCGPIQRVYAAWVTVAWPERYRQVGYFHEM